MARTPSARFTRTRSPQAQHAEWLSLLDISGPFLSLSVLTDAFPQGIEVGGDDSEAAGRLRRAYTEEWLPERARSRPDAAIHTAWIDFVLAEILGWPTGLVARGQSLPPGLEVNLADHGEIIRPDRVLLDPPDRGGKPRLLFAQYGPDQDLDTPVRDARSGSKASPATRMRDLLQATGVRVGLVTNGEEWLLVSAAAGEVTGFVTWHAYLWLEERETLRAFRTLLGTDRFFAGADDQTLESMLARSASDQAEVTTQLGDQVRQAIELLVAAIDRADRDRNGALLAGVPEPMVYEAAITTMMRLVFLLFAEDQRPPLFGNNTLYDDHYAVTSLIDALQEAADRSGEEVLERTHDAWSRLLSVFRLVHGGSDHDAMRLPAYGGSLFDPDRFPFLEGRGTGSHWEQDIATPLPISNRTVLHILEAIQFLQMRVGRGGMERRRLSFRALDVEQIGHVYERLLEHTVRRAPGPVLGLHGATRAGVRQEPEITLANLEGWRAQGEEALIDALAKPTGRTASQLRTALRRPLELGEDQRFLPACDNDPVLWDRVRPFAALVRSDRAGRPWVIRDGGLYVTGGTDRRQSGAHYTPRSLTEPIVQHALDPLVYVGPAEGAPRAEWRLRPASAILALTVCDPAMGSGAFLVQACRYLADRLVEAWEQIERSGGGAIRVAPDGSVSRGDASEDLLPADPKERHLRAMQLVTDHCLYGVDVNPLAVEMAKLSLWLVTLQKDRPFTFLDHRLRCGDSLLGVGNLDQLKTWSLTPGDATTPRQMSWFNQQVKSVLDEAARLRSEIAATPVVDVTDTDAKRRLLGRAEEMTGLVRLGADLLIASALEPDARQREIRRQQVQLEFSLLMESLRKVLAKEFTEEGAKPALDALRSLRERADQRLGAHRPFHWPLEYPEVLVAPEGRGESAGFGAMIGNPPFIGGTRISTSFGGRYLRSLQELYPTFHGRSDICSLFFVRAYQCIRLGGVFGLIATNTISQGDTRETGLDYLMTENGTLFNVVSSLSWPGASGVTVSIVHCHRGPWIGLRTLDNSRVSNIDSSLTASAQYGPPQRLSHNAVQSFSGSKLDGIGFVLEVEEAKIILAQEPDSRNVLTPYLSGDDITTSSTQSPSRWVINFGNRSLADANCFPVCFDIVRERVYPHRQRHAELRTRNNWWLFQRLRPEVVSTYTADD